MMWETGIPGKEGEKLIILRIVHVNVKWCVGTDWAGGVYKVTMEFPDEYPSKVFKHITFIFFKRFIFSIYSPPNANSSHHCFTLMYTPQVSYGLFSFFPMLIIID
jgi:hypothetical protein